MTRTKTSKASWKNEDSTALFQAILSIENLEEAQKFFRDLLTENEIAEFAQRWKVARLLQQRVSYQKIEKMTRMSSTTIARIHKWLKGGLGGYRLILGRKK